VSTWHFYDPESGRFIGRSFSGPVSHLEANTPDGSAAIEGNFDADTQRVNLATGEVESFAPEPSTEGNRDRQIALSRIAALESKQDRALRELALGYDGALDRLADIDHDISTLRARLL